MRAMQVEGEKVKKRLAEVLGYFALTATAIKARARFTRC